MECFRDSGTSKASKADYYLVEGNNYLLQGNYQKAILYLEKAIQLDPNDAISYNNLGYTYFDLAQYSQAISYLEKAIQYQEKVEIGERKWNRF